MPIKLHDVTSHQTFILSVIYTKYALHYALLQMWLSYVVQQQSVLLAVLAARPAFF